MKKCENKILDNLYEIREGEVEKTIYLNMESQRIVKKQKKQKMN